ncbi:MAG: F420-non-reducing hydrogenase iron-sulfur subunit G [Candidatus Heimdallarchaeota archaeon LC_2]|nr:MAG: F420-non-reducing hydrogenase iron-sulfur subunit G [Candidatus Heimdallarchaeota archaeon LC_2]
MSNGKPKVGFYWCGTCGGCEESVVDLAEGILDVVAAVDIIFWPVALDFKKEDVEAMPDNSIAVSFINGAIKNSEDVKICKLLRKKSGLIIAYGACAHMGGIPGLANFWNREAIFDRVYQEVPSVYNPNKTRPLIENVVDGIKLELPEIYDTVRKLDDIIPVDYYLPGCPPNPDLLMAGVQAILSGNLPPNGSILSPNRNMCETCPLERSEEKIKITEFKRPHEIIPVEGRCLLEQGIICLGPVTRIGCGELCMRVNMPCRGCYGPTDEIDDMGTKFASAMSSIIDTSNEIEAEQLLSTIPNFTGLVYMFSLPSSILKRRNMEVFQK